MKHLAFQCDNTPTDLRNCDNLAFSGHLSSTECNRSTHKLKKKPIFHYDSESNINNPRMEDYKKSNNNVS